MSLLDSVNGLTSSIAGKITQISTIAKIAACLPSIITSLPATLAAVGGAIVKSAVGSITELLSGAGGFLLGIVNETIGRITSAFTGLLNTVLSIQAQIIESINELKRLAKFIQDEYNDTAEWLKNSENCDFAAAELINCIAGRLLEDLSLSLSEDADSRLNLSFLDKALDKLESPEEKLSDWVNNTANQIDKATSIIDATRLF